MTEPNYSVRIHYVCGRYTTPTLRSSNDVYAQLQVLPQPDQDVLPHIHVGKLN